MTAVLVRDPVHGDVHLTATECRVLDCREVQRLRGIKQLGTAHLVFPGCTHTRFDHSLGVLAAAKRILQHLEYAGFTISAAERELVAVAALVHDVTHIPFGHTFEDERQIFPRHDSGPRTRWFLSDATEIGRTLRDLGLRDAVLDLLAGRGSAPWLTEVIASTVDADLLDYLRRDSYFAGLRQNYDDRIFSYFLIEGGHLVMNMSKHHQDRPDARSEILHLLRMRYYLTERVYLHHAKIAAGAMIAKAVELAARSFLRGEEPLYGLTDELFLDMLQRAVPDATVNRLAEDVRCRRLYKRAYVLSGASLGSQQAQIIQRFSGQSRERAALEESLARRAGLAPGEVILYCPRATFFKEAAVPVRTSRGVVPLSSLEGPLSGDVGALARQYGDLWRLYLFAPAARRAQVARAAEAEFGLPSEYQARDE